MKKILIILLTFFGFGAFAQLSNIPDSINYQAVLRDAAGNILPPGTSGTLNFKIFPDLITNTPVYEENHTFTTNAVGLVNLFIGGGAQVGTNTFANVNWGSGGVCYQVSLDGNPIGPRQIFGAVPYAIYAKTSGGGALPPGLQSQTLYYDQTFGGWKATNNLAHDGDRIGLGIAPHTKSKMRIFSNDPADSSLIFATRINANPTDALFRGIITGATNTSQFPIVGADMSSTNTGNGIAVGAAGTANVLQSAVAIGLSGVAKGPATSTLIGVYGAVDTLSNPNAFAAFFERGKVMIGDALFFPNVTAPPGSIYKLDALKRGYWAPSGTSTVSINQGGIISVNPNGPGTNFTVTAQPPSFLSTGLGSITLSSYPNYIFNLPTPTFSYNSGTSTMSFFQGTFVTSVNLSPSLSIASPNILNVGGNSITIPALSFWTRPTATATELGNPGDNVGIGAPNPTEKLVVQTNANTEVSIVGNLTNSSFLNLGSTITHTLGRIQYNNSANAMTFWTGGITNRMVIDNSGNVGIGNPVPSQRLDVFGNVIIPPANDYLYAGPKAQHFSVPSVAFTSENSDTYSGKFIAGHMYAVAAGGTVNCPVGIASYFEAPVNLPQGATVTAIDAYVVDGDPNYDISLVQLWRVNSPVGSAFGTSQIMAQTPATSGNNPNIQLLNDNTIANPVIDNQTYYYYIRYGGSYCGTGAAAQNIRLARIVVTYNVNKAD